MLNLTMKKAEATAKPVPLRVPSLQDVIDDIDRRVDAGQITVSTASSYRSAISLLARKLNKPVAHCRADIDEFDRRFPLEGFDTDFHDSEKAYHTWRRRARSALEPVLRPGVTRPATYDVEDDWTRLVAALKPYTQDHPVRWRIAPQKLIAVEQFAKTCRSHGRGPRDVDCAFMSDLETLYGGNKRVNHRGAAARLDEWRDIPEALPFLPAQPIGFSKVDHVKPIELPESFMNEIEPLIRSATEKDWDPIAQEYTTKHSKHARLAGSGFRTYLRTAVSIGALPADASSCLQVFLDPDCVRRVMLSLIERTKQEKGQQALAPRSLRKYVKIIVQVLSHAGHEPGALTQALTANRVLKVGATADRKMTPKNRAFCESLLARKDLKVKFLSSYLHLRRAAETIVDRAKAEGRGLTPQERSRAGILGMCAAFAAIEIAGAPLRVSNVREAKIYGDDAWIRVPEKGQGPIAVHIPAAFTKAKTEEIRFTIRHNRYKGHDTILWFVRCIRPLIPGAAGNPYLFPSPRKPGAPVSDGWFRDEFKSAARAVVGLPMCPHQFRHGQASLLLHKHPGDVVVIAKRTGHTVEALLRFYAFIDAIKAMERGQDMMIGLIDD